MAVLRRKIATLARILHPAPADRAYLRRLRRSGLFDAGFYRRANPRLHPLFRLMPMRHYVLLGEAIGLCPNPGFSPRAYLFHNPDLAGTDAAARPLLHYLDTGRAAGRPTLWPEDARSGNAHPLPRVTPADIPAAPAPVAVVLHLYYPDFWEEVAPVLAAQDLAFDLYVTLTDGSAAAGLAARIRAAMPQARIWVMPNLGRDIFPFVHLLNAGLFQPYRAICKLHSKASPHRADGADWRRGLVAGVLGAPGPTADRLARFLSDARAGLWVADGQRHRGEDWWGTNRPRTAELLARAGITPLPRPLCFAAGSIYWVKPAALAPLRGLRLGQRDFEPEQALVDGTTAHALERGIGLMLAAQGLAIRETRELDARAAHG